MTASSSTRKSRGGRVLTWCLLTVTGLIFGLPLLFLVVGAFKPGNRVLADSSSIKAFWPAGATLDNFSEAIHRADFFLLLRNSLVIAALTVSLGVVVNSMFGYALARFHFRGRGFLLGLVIALAVVPFQAVAIPLLYLMSNWGWRNTFRGLVLPFVGNPFYIYLFYSFFLSTPKELEEAATLDGAGPWRVFRSVAVPLARPAFATVAILSFLASWSELLWPALMTDDTRVRPLPMGIAVFRSTPPINQGVILAVVLLSAVPMFVVFLILQRRFIASVARTGIRG